MASVVLTKASITADRCRIGLNALFIIARFSRSRSIPNLHTPHLFYGDAEHNRENPRNRGQHNRASDVRACLSGRRIIDEPRAEAIVVDMSAT